MVENSIPLGLIAEIGDETAAWRRVGELGLVEKYIDQPLSGKPMFRELSIAYVKDGLPFRKKDGHREGKGTIETYQYHINNLILPRWKNVIAEKMKPLEIRNWLYDLHDGDDYRWETCSKTAGIMSLVFDFVDHNELCSIRNPMDKVTIPASEEQHPTIRLLTPEEVFLLVRRLPSPINIAVLLVAATGVRVSECLGLRWSHVLWHESKISIEQVFRRGEILNRTKTKASKAPVPMCEALARTLDEFTPADRIRQGRGFCLCLTDTERQTAVVGSDDERPVRQASRNRVGAGGRGRAFWLAALPSQLKHLGE
jgi:integrase